MSDNEKYLINSIVKSQWGKARSILEEIKKNFQKQIEFSDVTGLNALHRASDRDAPLDVWRSLLSVSTVKAMMKQDNDGETPLSWSIGQSSEEKIMMLIEACPQAASVSDNWGWMPLHWAILCNKSTRIIRRLLISHPYAIMATNDQGDTPLHTFFKIWDEGLKNIFNVVLHENDKLSSIIQLDVQEQYFGYTRTVQDIHDIATLLVQAKVHGTIESLPPTSFRSLHSAILVQHCPCSFFSMFLRIYPEGATQQDQEGNFPLHLAPLAKGEEISEIIDRIITTFPKSAQFPNNEGRLPFNIAIQNGKSFEETIVEKIYHAAPKALQSRDIQFHMYPFMLSATKYMEEETRINNQNEDKCFKQFTSCFALLMEDPNLSSWGIRKMTSDSSKAI